MPRSTTQWKNGAQIRGPQGTGTGPPSQASTTYARSVRAMVPAIRPTDRPRVVALSPSLPRLVIA